jgi:hypothetical protein
MLLSGNGAKKYHNGWVGSWNEVVVVRIEVFTAVTMKNSVF